MKKLIWITLGLILMASCTTGCGSEQTTKTSNTPDSKTAATDSKTDKQPDTDSNQPANQTETTDKTQVSANQPGKAGNSDNYTFADGVKVTLTLFDPGRLSEKATHPPAGSKIIGIRIGVHNGSQKTISTMGVQLRVKEGEQLATRQFDLNRKDFIGLETISPGKTATVEQFYALQDLSKISVEAININDPKTGIHKFNL